MSEAFRLAVDRDGLATVTFDLPDKSANVFTREATAELERLVAELAERDEIRCLVLLSGKPTIFIAGADVEEISEVIDPDQAAAGAQLGQQLFGAWERLPFPTLAAIRGTCLGGGTELALACSRIAISDRRDIRIGLPEIRLGIVPGWGGCTRLPRKVGIAPALEIILAGKAVSSRKAKRIGLADDLLPDADFPQQVSRLARRMLAGDGPTKRSAGPDFKALLLEKNPIGRRLLFDQARRRTLKLTGGNYPAPLRAIEVVRTGVEKGLEAGLEAEARAIGELAVSRVCKNLIGLFNEMERAKGRGGRSGGAARARRLERIGVVGAGIMGGGIAQLVTSRTESTVRLKDIAIEPLASAMQHASGLFSKLVRRRRMTPAESARRLGRILPTLDGSGLESSDLVIEAIVENLDLKRRVFAEIGAIVSDETVLASNTSSLSIDDIARDTARPERVVGMHFFNPVHKMPLVEVIAGRRTCASAIDAVVSLSRDLGKTAIVVSDTPGFLVNRLLTFYGSEAMWLLDDGQEIGRVDRIVEEWGMPMGPFALADMAGLDVSLKVGRVLQEAFGDRLALPEWVDRLGDQADRRGAKTGKGYYRYKDGRRQDPDPEVYKIFGLQRRSGDPDDADVIERLLLPVVNEAARCLDEGVVSDAGQLDLALIMGIGFPPFRGGLCRWADAQGTSGLLALMERLADEVDERYRASPAFRSVVEAGGFYPPGS